MNQNYMKYKMNGIYMRRATSYIADGHSLIDDDDRKKKTERELLLERSRPIVTRTDFLFVFLRLLFYRGVPVL